MDVRGAGDGRDDARRPPPRPRRAARATWSSRWSETARNGRSRCSRASARATSCCPCTEQLRPKDLAQRLDVAQPRIVVADARNAATLNEANWAGDTLWVPFEEDASHTAPPPAELGPEDPCLITFTSGTAGEPKAVLHGQRYLTGQHLQAEHWLAPRPGDLVWCTAAAGWSKSARNAFIAPWISGAAALLHDARFDPAGAAGARTTRARRRPLHGPDGVPRDRQARAAHTAPQPPRPRRRGRGAQPGGAARLARGDGPLDPRRLRPDGDRPAHRRSAGRDAAPRLDGPPAARASTSTSSTANSCSTRRPTRRSSSATSAPSRTTARGTPATGSRATRTATCTSRAARTT